MGASKIDLVKSDMEGAGGVGTPSEGAGEPQRWFNLCYSGMELQWDSSTRPPAWLALVLYV